MTMPDAPLQIPEALTFDDVLLVPRYSAVTARDVDPSTIVAGIRLHTPLIAAAMDTVTESALAIAIAHEGGIGIVHKNLSPAAQALEVRKVKKSESGMIVDPVCIDPDLTLGDALHLMRQFNISGIPVVKGATDGHASAGKLVGIITNRDIRFHDNPARKIHEMMTTALVTAPEGTTLQAAKVLLHKHRIEKLPVVGAAGELRGLITIKDIEKNERHPLATKDKLGRLRVGAALGVGGDNAERLEALVEVGVDVVAIDTAHGHSAGVIAAVQSCKKRFPELPVIAGNVATAEGTLALIDAGADAIKVGIGPGSICTTRIVAGVGVPQLSAVLECAAAAEKASRGRVCVVADGGIRHSGDIVKALAAGAGVVMVGSLLAGTDESPGEVVLYQGRSYKSYRGMGSMGAMERGSADRYFQAGTQKLVPEGVEGLVPYKGALGDTVHQLIGGLRSGMGYCGAETLEHLAERRHFVRLSNAGFRESHVHDVTVTKEAPNYRV